MKKLSLIFLLITLLISCVGQREEEINKRVTEIESKKNKDNEDKYLELWTTGLYWADKDKKTAEKYYLAAAKYNKEAYSMIGNMYYFRGEKEKGKEKYREGFAKGDMNSAFELGGVYDAEGNIKEAMKWYTKAAEGEHREAQFNLAICYKEQGDDIEAEKWYLKAANRNHVNAQNNLGSLYWKKVYDIVGKLTKEKNTEEKELELYGKLEFFKIEAEKWFLKAAEQGDQTAQYNLGNLYKDSGKDSEAKKWYLKSAEQGNEKAKMKLAKMK